MGIEKAIIFFVGLPVVKSMDRKLMSHLKTKNYNCTIVPKMKQVSNCKKSNKKVWDDFLNPRRMAEKKRFELLRQLPDLTV